MPFAAEHIDLLIGGKHHVRYPAKRFAEVVGATLEIQFESSRTSSNPLFP